jgi:hypothetical protein
MSMLERAKIDLGVLALAAAGFSCRMQHTEQLIAGDNYNDLRIVSSLGPNHSVLPDPEIVTALEDIHERLREAILYRGILPRIPKDTLITDLVRNLDYAAHNTLSQNCTAIESESAPYLLEGLELFDRPLLNDLISNTQLHKSGLRYAPDPIFKEFSKAPSTILLDPTSSIQAQELTIIPLQVTFKLEGDELNVRLIDILKPSDPIYWSKQFSLQSSSTALCGELVRVAEEYYKKLWKAYPQGWLDDYEAVSSNGGIIYRQTTIAPALHLDRTKAPSSEDLRAWRDVLKECDIVLVFTIRGQLAAAQDKLAKYQCFRLKKSDLANLKNSSLRLDGDLVAVLNVNRDSDLEITPKLLSSLSDSSYLGQDVITSFFLGPIFAERSDLTYGLSFNDMYEPIICSSVVEQGYLLSLSPYVSNSTVNGFTIYSSRSDQALVQPLYQKILEFTEGVNLAQKFFGVDPGVRIISLVEIESDNVLAKTVLPYAKQSYYQLPIDQLGARFGQWNL